MKARAAVVVVLLSIAACGEDAPTGPGGPVVEESDGTAGRGPVDSGSPAGRADPARDLAARAASLDLAGAMRLRFGGSDAAQVARVASLLVESFAAGRVAAGEVAERVDFLGFADIDRLLALIAERCDPGDDVLCAALAPELELAQADRLVALCATPHRDRALALLGPLLARSVPRVETWTALATALGIGLDESSGNAPLALALALAEAPGTPLASLAPALALALGRHAPEVRQAPLLGRIARAAGDQRLRRAAIRVLGFCADDAGRALLAELSRAEGGSAGPDGLLALAALARRGDAAASRALGRSEEPLARALRLDLAREQGYEAVLQDLAAEDPWTFEQALLLIEQCDERAWEGFVDPRGLVPGTGLPPLLCSAGFPLARTLAIVHAVPGCRTVAVAEAILAHRDFADLPRLVELDEPRVEVLAFIDVAAGDALRTRMRAAASMGPVELRPFWSARLAELGESEAVSLWLARLAADPTEPAAPSLARLAVHAPDKVPALARRILETDADFGERLRMTALQALAVAGGVPIATSFPHPADLEAIGAEKARAIELALLNGDCTSALRGFFASWTRSEPPYCSVAALGLDPRWKPLLAELGTRRTLDLHPQVLAGLALAGDPGAADQVRRLREDGRIGFLRLFDPLARTADLDPAQCAWWVGRLSASPERSDRVAAEILPLYGLHPHPRMWPERRALRLELAAGRVLRSALTGTCLPAPRR